jgi:hypothetical protein
MRRFMTAATMAAMLVAFTGAHCATRAVGESAASFAARVAPAGAELAHAVIEAKPWTGRATPVIAFYGQTFDAPGMENTGARSIRAVVYVPEPAGDFAPVELGMYEPEGGNPRIESVFFGSVRGLAKPALFVLVSWEQNHATVRGTYYATYAYEFQDDRSPPAVRLLDQLSANLEGGCECWREGEPRSRAKFKNAAEIRAAISRMRAQ